MVTPAFAQQSEIPPAETPDELGAPHDTGPAHAEPGHTVESTEAHGGEHGAGHGAFPPFDPATYGSQLFWLAITFGALYYLMSKIVLPRIATILEERNDRIADDLAEAERLKRETDAAIAAYEQALAEARQKAHGIAQTARDKAKSELDRQRASIEADLGTRMDAAERQIADVKTAALADVGTIARDAASAIVETLLGTPVPESEVTDAVGASMGRGG